MGTAGRKQREIEEREAKILQVSRRILASEGYIKLNMDRIAAEIEYAKGTVYQHFRNKEDIIVALDIEAHQAMADLFRLAATFDGSTRHRMTAVGVASNLKNQLYPDHLQIDRITCNPAILEKATEERQERLRDSEGACMAVLADLVRVALDDHDLCLPEHVAPEDLVFGLWAMSSGAYEIISSGIPLFENGVTNPMAALWHNFTMLLDGYGWKPLSHEENYLEIGRRAWVELFSKDYSEFEPVWLVQLGSTA
jgi:AcrR family transcriptional regulator